MLTPGDKLGYVWLKSPGHLPWIKQLHPLLYIKQRTGARWPPRAPICSGCQSISYNRYLGFNLEKGTFQSSALGLFDTTVAGPIILKTNNPQNLTKAPASLGSKSLWQILSVVFAAGAKLEPLFSLGSHFLSHPPLQTLIIAYISHLSKNIPTYSSSQRSPWGPELSSEP